MPLGLDRKARFRKDKCFGLDRRMAANWTRHLSLARLQLSVLLAAFRAPSLPRVYKRALTVRKKQKKCAFDGAANKENNANEGVRESHFHWKGTSSMALHLALAYL